MTDPVRPYLPHIYDETRQVIAVQFVRHELRKLFPSLRDDATWRILDNDVVRWFTDSPNMFPVRDFWNGVHGISMGFRLKNIVSWLTSAHIQWNLVQLPTQSLHFATTFEELINFPPRAAAAEVAAWYHHPDNAAALKKALAAHEFRSGTSASRDSDPIIVVERENKMLALDGNRRLLRAILHKSPAILAAYGKPLRQPDIFEHWVPTQSLIEIISWHRYGWDSETKAETLGAAQVLAGYVRSSSAGRYELVYRSFNAQYPADRALYQATARLFTAEPSLLDPLPTQQDK